MGCLCIYTLTPFEDKLTSQIIKGKRPTQRVGLPLSFNAD
jgi:hypothetical protein